VAFLEHDRMLADDVRAVEALMRTDSLFWDDDDE